MSRLLINKGSLFVNTLKNVSRVSLVPVRNLNLIEYQSKLLLRNSGVSVQNFTIIDDLNHAKDVLDKFSKYYLS